MCPDADEGKQPENRLRRSEAYVAIAQQLSHTGSFGWTPATGEFHWSDETFRILEYDPGIKPTVELVLRRVHPDDRATMRGFFEEASSGEKDFDITHRLLMPDCSVKFVRVLSHALKPAADEVEIVGALMDLTENTLLYRALADRETRLVERTQELRRSVAHLAEVERFSHTGTWGVNLEGLHQLEANLAHMNRLSMMGELAASLAHEIAQPIAAARNNARAAEHFLDRSPPDLSQVREALGGVVDDSDRAGDILDRIRDHIKNTPLRNERVDLNRAIIDVIPLAQGAITKNAVSVQTRLTDGLSRVRADRVQLQQVVLNLILNAVEAMGSIEAGIRELSISTTQHETGGVLVAVRDSGPGIDPEHLDRVFDAFYTTKSSGVGIGLSICRSIIHAHGGRLWADVTMPRGAVFQFTLPDADNALTSSYCPAQLPRGRNEYTVLETPHRPVYE